MSREGPGIIPPDRSNYPAETNVDRITWPAVPKAVSDARTAVLDQLADAFERHVQAEQDARAEGRHQAAYEHHGAVLLLDRMCKEAER